MLFNTQKMGKSSITCKKAGFPDIRHVKYKSFCDLQPTPNMLEYGPLNVE